MAYLIDSDVFIEAKNRYYGFDFCPGFWDWLVQKLAGGEVLSVERVGQELAAGNDNLAAWAANQGAALFVPPDANTVAAMATVSASVNAMRVNGQPYLPAAVTKFLGNADYYLIAHTLAHRDIVVTNESGHLAGQQASIKTLKIPDICNAVGVQCASVFKMLRDGGAVLVI
jgi:hypothetical protein